MASAAAGITAMVQEGTGAAGDMLEAAEQQIYAIRRGRSAQGMVTVGMVLGDVMSQLAELTASGRSERCRACPPAFPPWMPRSTA